MATNKVKYGLRNVHYAVLTEAAGQVTYGTPIPFPGGVTLSLSAAGDVAPFYADDMEYYTSITNNGYEGTLEAALIPESFRTSVLGEVLSTTDKVLTENSNADPGRFALLFEFQGDVKAIRHVIYNCKATRPNIESGTRQGSAAPQTDALTLAVKPLPDGVVKRKTTEATPTIVYDGWYTAVYVGESEGD